MQLFRNYIRVDPKGPGKAFYDLEPIDILFNAQPDWKTWDTDPIVLISQALGLLSPCTIYGNAITANAANRTLQDMHHTEGFVLSTDEELRRWMVSEACKYRDENPKRNLLRKDYDYINGIKELLTA